MRSDGALVRRRLVEAAQELGDLHRPRGGASCPLTAPVAAMPSGPSRNGGVGIGLPAIAAHRRPDRGVDRARRRRCRHGPPRHSTGSGSGSRLRAHGRWGAGGASSCPVRGIGGRFPGLGFGGRRGFGVGGPVSPVPQSRAASVAASPSSPTVRPVSNAVKPARDPGERGGVHGRADPDRRLARRERGLHRLGQHRLPVLRPRRGPVDGLEHRAGDLRGCGSC